MTNAVYMPESQTRARHQLPPPPPRPPISIPGRSGVVEQRRPGPGRPPLSGSLLGHEGTDLRTEPRNAAGNPSNREYFCSFAIQMTPDQLAPVKWIPGGHMTRSVGRASGYRRALRN